ncbi:hypothetical protein LTR22_020703 [Elasticomyces elasticus]|nr:hypothetical protein LTR22_020703 [Elasticomyces elasticus]KAK4906312.1 hypothetical protein LTR49_024510 [Elasticomyces elasticus]KAK5744296.1 hypothetical protein LTS12_023513 [Elasticomyces elasticus]
MTIRYITQPAVLANTDGTHDNPTTRSNTPVPVTHQTVPPEMRNRCFEVMQDQEAASAEPRTTTVHPLKKRFRRNPQSRGKTHHQKSTQNNLVFSQTTLKIFILTIAILYSIVLFAGLEALDRWSGLNATTNMYGMIAVVAMCVWLPCDMAQDLVKLGREGAKAGK